MTRRMRLGLAIAGITIGIGSAVAPAQAGILSLQKHGKSSFQTLHYTAGSANNLLFVSSSKQTPEELNDDNCTWIIIVPICTLDTSGKKEVAGRVWTIQDFASGVKLSSSVSDFSGDYAGGRGCRPAFRGWVCDFTTIKVLTLKVSLGDGNNSAVLRRLGTTTGGKGSRHFEISGGDGEDAFNLKDLGRAARVRMSGGGDDDSLTAPTKATTVLRGQKGDDRLEGGNGQDTLNGGDGASWGSRTRSAAAVTT